VPISPADACLVSIAEMHAVSPVVALDGGFRVYRRNARQALALISPWS